MATPRNDDTLVDARVQAIVGVISNGGLRSDCIRFASEQGWGVTTRTVENYIAKARDLIRADFDIERPQLIAEFLKRLLKYEKQAEATNQPAVAIQAIVTMAKLTGCITSGK